MVSPPEEEYREHSAYTIPHAREDSEYVNLVVSNESIRAETDLLQTHPETRTRSRTWWIKAIIWCFGLTILLIVSLKWGAPFFVNKENTCLESRSGGRLAGRTQKQYTPI